MEDLLAANDFSEEFIAAIRERAKKEFSLETLENYPLLMAAVVGWIGERIEIDQPLRIAGKGTQILVIVGPTGVGKTTTIAKLAAIHGIGDGRQPPRRVRIITIDNYRIAAKQQIETYAEIMRIPVSLVESAADLQKCLALNQDAELILIDTIGRSPRDLAKLAEMKEILSACGSQAERVPGPRRHDQGKRHGGDPAAVRALRLSRRRADEAGRDDEDRQHHFVPFASPRKPIAYLCDGQGVPQDIEEARVVRLLMNMEGFRVDRETLERGRTWEGRRPRGRTGRHGGRSAGANGRPARWMVAARTSPRAAAARGPDTWQTRQKS